jgi:hypothetical protein
LALLGWGTAALMVALPSDRGATPASTDDRPSAVPRQMAGPPPASRAAAYVTGISIAVDGGRTNCL